MIASLMDTAGVKPTLDGAQSEKCQQKHTHQFCAVTATRMFLIVLTTVPEAAFIDAAASGILEWMNRWLRNGYGLAPALRSLFKNWLIIGMDTSDNFVDFGQPIQTVGAKANMLLSGPAHCHPQHPS
ncbi:hypothetical protein [Noviherbaspirillum galbum]|uniref:Uncharacterized protein n=1 Tax=Noviherbaspirillum galbum TaxID=2709383 RepID=A0A6B3SRA9_9BURK|nr:hypothetical protein [Noviherbaspirillum galbum]NEX63307.1 hypothetical protein [Noviherbaspirillum galbum]